MENIWSRFDKVVPVVSHLEVHLPNKPLTPRSTGEAIKGPRRKFWKEYLFVQYDKNKNIILLLSPMLIKSLPDVTKVLH